jgi:hypothetical protein
MIRPYNGISPSQSKCASRTPTQLDMLLARGRGGENNPLLPDNMKQYYQKIAWDLFDDRRFKLPPYTFVNGRVIGDDTWAHIFFRYEDMTKMDMFTGKMIDEIEEEWTRREIFLASLHRCETARLSALGGMVLPCQIERH